MKWSVNRTPVIGKALCSESLKFSFLPFVSFPDFIWSILYYCFTWERFFVCFLSNFAWEVGENWSTRACSTLSHRVPRELGGFPGYEYIDQELQSEWERFSSFLSLSIRKYPWKRATTRDPNGTLRLFANSSLGRNTADNRSGVTGWSYKIWR